MAIGHAPQLSGRRILLVSDHGRSGGTRTYARQLAELYTSQGANVTLVSTCSNDGDFAQAGIRCISYREVVGRDEPSTRNGASRRMEALLRIASERSAFASLIEAESVQDVVVSVGRPGALLGVVNAAPASYYFVHTYPHGWKNVVVGRLAYSRLIPPGSNIVTVSNYARTTLEQCWRLRRSGPRVTRIYSTAGPLVSPSVRRDGVLRVLTVGSVTKYKDPIGWIALAHSVLTRMGDRKVEFTWVGDGPLLDRCRRLSGVVGEGISFAGHREDTDPFYAVADVYVQPSRIESLGLASLDAARHGIPAIVSAVGGLPETLEPDVSGFVVESTTAASTADILHRLLMEPGMRRDMGAAQRAQYSRKFLPETWARQILTLHGETK